MNFVGWCVANHCCARIESDTAACIYNYCARVGDIVRYRMLECTCASLRCRSHLVTELGYRSKVLCTWRLAATTSVLDLRILQTCHILPSEAPVKD